MIFGYGGIGSALVEKLLERGEDVLVVSQNVKPPSHKITTISFDNLYDALQDKLPDYIINTIGILHDSEHQPEKNINQLNLKWLEESIVVNVMPTASIAQSLAKVMKPDTALKMMSISARVSSITDNRLGGWYSYRMSKAALNMLIKNIAIEWARQYPKAAIFGYHPGTVDTPLSQPFQSNVPKEQLFSPQKAANYLLEIFQRLTVEDSGNLFDWEGKKIPF